MRITDFLTHKTHFPVTPDQAGLGHYEGDCSYDPVHGGVDIFAPKGTSVYAVANGDVIWANGEAYAGNVVVILHESNVVSKYFHLDQFFVSQNERVQCGQLIGKVGNTGKVCTLNPSNDGSGRCQPHLHFEIGVGLNEPYYTPDRFMYFNPLPVLPDMLQKFSECHSFPLALDAPARRGWYVRVPISYIPLFLRLAIIAVEDRRFYHHFGVDIKSLIRATVENLRHKRVVQGGSTITQQAARSAFLATEKGWKRKVVETIVAMVLETFYSKNAILELYFNTTYWGRGSIGIQAASHNFLYKHLLDLNFRECLLLSTLVNLPLGWDISSVQWQDRESRMALVLKNMYEQKMIDSYIFHLAERQPVKIVEFSNHISNHRDKTDE